MCLIYLCNGEQINYITLMLLKQYKVLKIKELAENIIIYTEEQKKQIFLEILYMAKLENNGVVFSINQKNYENYNTKLKYLEAIKDITDMTKYNNFLNSFYKNQMYQSQDYDNLTKFHKKQGENGIIIEPYNINYSNYKKNNYSVNRILNTDDSSRSNNNFFSEQKRDSLSNNYIGNMIVVPNRKIQGNKSPYMKNSAENSVDKGSTSFNYSINRPNKRNFFEESYQGNRTLLNNEENYIKKRTMGLKKNLAPKDIPQKSIFIFDRGYNSMELMARIINMNSFFVIRQKKTHTSVKENI